MRAELRAARRAVNRRTRADAAHLVARHVDRAFRLCAGQRIALYSALPEELDTQPLMELARSRGCTIYLPRIDAHTHTLRFIEASRSTFINRYGIEEPLGSRVIGARWLDLAFVPLVGFDASGTRLGMGGGYYDRAFAFRYRHDSWRGPQLIGLAFALQQRTFIPRAAHDVAMDAVVTEAGVIHSRKG